MKKRNVRFTTEVGIAKWPHLNKPDTKFDKDGAYKVSLILDKDSVKGIMSSVKEVLKDFVDGGGSQSGKMAPLPIRDDKDDAGNPNGNFEVKFKLRAIGGRQGDTWEQRPALFDSSGKPMTELIGGGSKVKVGCEIVPYSTGATGTGITLRLKAVQVIELVTVSSGDSFESWSFSEEEGFTTDGKQAEEKDIPVPPGEGDFDW
jgi:hypothetical protein